MKVKLNLFYNKLYNFFGPQKWWPADSPFEVMIGAILTQNTNWANVEKAITNLKTNKLLNPQKLYSITDARLAKLIRPAGYYNIKAKRIKNFLSFFVKIHKGDIKRLSGMPIEKLRKELLAINGIGPETADSIILYALEKPAFVVDAYTKRILLRHKMLKSRATYEEIQNLFRNSFKKDVKLFNEYHALLVRTGKDFCLKSKPKCQICPLKS
jgi:endonuclease-3 related protein